MLVACKYVSLCVIELPRELPREFTEQICRAKSAARDLQRTRLRIRFAGRGSLMARDPI
jgi:hypothetical protein